MMAKPAVLFLCTGNSARSQMAEALLRRLAGDRFEVHSAGLRPTAVHPLAIRVLEEIGVETRELHSKGVQSFLGKVSVRYAIIVCARAADACPRIFPFALQTLHWPFEDPAEFQGSPEEQLRKFRDVRDQIDGRIRTWVLEEARTC